MKGKWHTTFLFLIIIVVFFADGKLFFPIVYGQGREFAKQKAIFEEVKQEYVRLKTNGYDVSKAGELIPHLRKAIQTRDIEEASILLDKIKSILDEISMQSKKDTSESQPGTSPPKDTTNLSLEPIPISPKFGFGIEYAQEGIAKAYKEFGANWVKIPLVDWGRIEPAPPKGNVHTYDWVRLDKIISEFQSYGFHIMVVLKARSMWGSTPPSKDHPFTLGYVSSPPRDEYWDDYAKFVYSIVERYDKDGFKDMPGLKIPILHYEIESEAQHRLFWQGTVDDYIKLLKVSYSAAKKANSYAKIILSGLSFGDIFDDGFPVQRLEERINSLPENKQGFLIHSLSFIKKTLEQKDIFDEVEFHYLNDYRGVYGQVEFIRNEMRRNGYEKPIWAGDATAAPFIVSSPFSFNPYMPAEKGLEVFELLKDKKHPKHLETLRWYFAEQAKNLVKKFVVGMEVGLEGIMMGNTVDWLSYQLPNFVYQGLIDERKNPRPAYHSYKLLIDKLHGFNTIERLFHTDNIYAYRFSGNKKKPVYVLWAEGKEAYVDIELEAKEAALIRIPTNLDQMSPQREVLTVHEGKVRVRVDSTPLFIEGI